MAVSTASRAPANGRPCRVCGAGGDLVTVDLGTAAACSDYPKTPDQYVQRIPFRLGACANCGLIQLRDSPELDWLRPPREAVLFRDPERHLDDLCAAMISHIPDRQGLILGLTYKDVPVLDRFRAAGFTRTMVLDRSADWRLTSPRDGIETMQRTLTPDWARTIRDRHGPADVLCVRHLLEHAHDVPQFLAGCRELLSPDGWALFETPGCETELSRGDAGSLWEEHVLYFTPTTLRRGLERYGFRCRWVANYPYAVEDCLAAFGQFGATADRETRPTDAGVTLLAEFQSARHQLRLRLADCANRAIANKRKLALWGAGHRTATFVELLPAQELVACVIDDDPSKQGSCLPGSNLPILSAEALSTQDIGVCVGLLNPDVMHRISARHPEFTARGGRFLTLSELALAADGSYLFP